jgi:hypothetical protein
VCSEVRSESLKQAIRGIKELVQSAIAQTADSKMTLTYIDQFLKQIDTAKAGQTNELLKNLFTGLANVEYTMSCYNRKVRTILTHYTP